MVTTPTFTNLNGPNSGSIIPTAIPTGGGFTAPVPTPPITPTQSADQKTATDTLANQGKPGFDVFGKPVAAGSQVQATGETYKGQDGKDYYVASGQPVQTSTTTPTVTATGTQNGTKNTDTGTPTLADQTDRAALAQAQAEYQATAKQVQDAITSISNGTTPLNAGEQAQVDGLKQQFEQLIQQQQLTNTGAFGAAQMRGYQGGAAEYDPTFQAKTIGSVVSAGIAKVSDLQVKEASAVAALTQSLKDNNIKGIKDAYSIYQDASKARQDALQKTIDDTQKAIKDAQDAKIAAEKVVYDQVTKPIQDIAAEVLKNTGDKALAASIGKANTVEEALAAAGDSLQTATGDLGDYLAYKRQAIGNGKTPSSYDDFLKAKKAADAAQEYNKAYASAKGKAAGEAAAGVTNLKPLTQQQSTDFTYAQRGDLATPIIDSSQNSIASMDAAGYIAAKAAYGNDYLYQFVPSNLKNVFQAEKNFASAVLRRESGAAISASEYETVDSTYFPRPGDDATTLANKAQLRQTAIDSIKSNIPDYTQRVNQTTPTGILNQAEDLSQSAVIDYGSKNPQAQASIKQMVADGKSYTDIKQLLGI